MDIKLLEVTPPWDWPRDAGKTLLNILTNRKADASHRLIAAELAGDLVVINDKLAESLLTIVSNPAEPEDLRATAAIAFGAVLELAYRDEFDDPEEIPIAERTFDKIQDSLRKLFVDNSTPKEVQRRILEASVRAPDDWHQSAIETAYSSGDRDWMLTAVFAMRWVRGFEHQILEALESTDPEIHYEAVEAAGNWEVAAAWPHVLKLVRDKRTEKQLLIAAIEAVGSIRPAEARDILDDLADSRDEDIAEAAEEAIMMAEAGLDEEDEEDEDDAEWIN